MIRYQMNLQKALGLPVPKIKASGGVGQSLWRSLSKMLMILVYRIAHTLEF